jgi:hypothetical protein
MASVQDQDRHVGMRGYACPFGLGQQGWRIHDHQVAELAQLGKHVG